MATDSDGSPLPWQLAKPCLAIATGPGRVELIEDE
jgi:hypothetical protein